MDALNTKGNRRLREIKLAEGIETACRILGITLDADRRAHLLTLDAGGLEQLLAKLESERRWPLA